jgi:hypothetical protein
LESRKRAGHARIAGIAGFFKDICELARDCENTSLTRFASGPAFRALREMKKLPKIGIQKKSGAAQIAGMAGFF